MFVKEGPDGKGIEVGDQFECGQAIEEGIWGHGTCRIFKQSTNGLKELFDKLKIEEQKNKPNVSKIPKVPK